MNSFFSPRKLVRSAVEGGRFYESVDVLALHLQGYRRRSERRLLRGGSQDRSALSYLVRLRGPLVPAFRPFAEERNFVMSMLFERTFPSDLDRNLARVCRLLANVGPLRVGAQQIVPLSRLRWARRVGFHIRIHVHAERIGGFVTVRLCWCPVLEVERRIVEPFP